MTLLKQDFKPGQPISSVPASWFNAVANFLNNLIGLNGISVARTCDPPQIRLDIPKVKAAMNVAEVCPNAPAPSGQSGDSSADVAARAPKEVAEYEDPSDESVADKTARIGTSPFAAREDHQHRLPKNVVVVPDDFDFTQMFQTSAGTTSSYTKITLTPLKINSTTNELDWDTDNAISFEVLNARIITPS